MSEVKHTPGPWRVFFCDDGGQWTGWPLCITADSVTNANGDGRLVVRTGGQWPYEWDNGTSIMEADANARLIAAAPDLLEALKMVLPENNMRDGKIAYPGFEVCEIARAAIAKAEGRS